MMRVAHCPQKQGHKPVANGDTIARLKPWSAGLTEMADDRHTFIPHMERGLGEDYGVRYATIPHQSRSRENAVVTRARPLWRVTNVYVVQVSKETPGEKGIGNPRFITIVERERWGLRRKKRRKAVHIASHWNAVIQDKETGKVLDNARADAMAKAGRILEDYIKDYLARGYTVFVTGDFNYRRKGNSQFWHWAPERIFRRTGLKFFPHGLDYLAYSPDVVPSKPIRVIEAGKGGNHSDHPWIVADFKWRR